MPQRLLLLELDNIRTRVAAASPGPWRALTGLRQNDARFGPSACVPMLLANNENALCEFSAWLSDADRSFISNARTDVEALLAEVERGHAALAGEDNWRRRLAERLDLRAGASWVDILDAVDSILDNDPNLEE